MDKEKQTEEKPQPPIQEETKNENEDEALNALDDFDEKLNLTADERDNESENDFGNANEMNEEFEKLMKDFQQGADPGIGMDPNKIFSEMFGNGKFDANNMNMEDLADNLLGEFLNKDILYEPLKEAKTAYETYLQENKEKLTATETSNYESQYNILICLLDVLETEPSNKEKLTNLFEQMQEKGAPPPIFGDSGFPLPFNPLQPQSNGQVNPDNCNIQ